MSQENLLERVGRGIKSSVVGVPNQLTDSQQRDRGHTMLKNMGAGGLMLGGGTAAVVAAVNLLKSLQAERDMNDDDRLDDNTLYISDPKAKREALAKAAADGVSPLLAPGLAMTAGIVGTGAGYALVQGVWNAAERKRRLGLLDEAQRETIESADAEAVKAAAASAPAKVNLSDLVTASPVALPLLTMLATGGLTYAALHKSFPTLSKPKRVGPRRIRVESQPYQVPDEDVTEEETAESVKAASFRNSDLADAGNEFLASIVAAAKPDTIIGGMICKSAGGQLGDMEELFKSGGADALLALAKACRKNHVVLLVCGLMHQPLDIARRCGFVAQVREDQLHADLAQGIAAAVNRLQQPTTEN